MADAPAGAAADNPDLVQAHIASYHDADSRMREVAKWFVTSAAALAALLIGTSPLSGLADLSWSAALVVPLLAGFVALGALAAMVYTTSLVLAPATVDLKETCTDKDFAAFRDRIEGDSDNYLGAGIDDFAAFMRERARDFATLESIDKLQADPATPKADLALLTESRTKIQAKIKRTGWACQRLLAAAENDRLWRKFQAARLTMVIGTVVTAIAIVVFLVSVHAGATAKADDEITAPLPVKVALTAAGKAELGQVLGPACPTGAFDALLLDGGDSAPWTIQVVDRACTAGRVTITGDQGRLLFVSGP